MISSYKHSGFKGKIRRCLVVLSCVFLSNCVEEFDFETEDFESILVINATVTNELKRQQVHLTRTFRFEDNGPVAEQGATVKVIENANTEYIFEEFTAGIYQSNTEFAAVPGRQYQLSVQTQGGRSYISDVTTLPQETEIDRVYPMRTTNDDGEEGVGILVDTFDPTGNANFYRYEFEETYRVSAPFWVSLDIIALETDGEITFDFVERPIEQRTCFNSEISNDIIVTNTNALDGDGLTAFELEFIRADDIRIAERYSILVRQYVQSQEANGFYKTLLSFSESESLFSQVQPGFITGNVTSLDNPDELVIGFFDVSSVSEQRIFFNHDDVLPDLLPFTQNCTRIIPTPEFGETQQSFLQRVRDIINNGRVRFLDEVEMGGPGAYIFVPTPCGDCRELGSTVVPSFWIDE